jgi:hypothetical protein
MEPIKFIAALKGVRFDDEGEATVTLTASASQLSKILSTAVLTQVPLSVTVTPLQDRLPLGEDEDEA